MRYHRISSTAVGECVHIRLAGLASGPTGGWQDGGVSIDAATAAELRECCRELALADEVRAVVVAGAGGGVFAVGREPLPGMEPGSEPESGLWAGPGAELRVAEALGSLPMPVVAAVNGDAIAHGLELALAADLRVAGESARLGTGDPATDGFPYDGATQRLPRLVGPGLARDLLFTGRMLSAQEALAAGLVNRVVPDGEVEDAAAALAGLIASAAPLACRYAKEAVRAAGDLTLAQGLRLEADLSIILQSTADRAEGLRSFAEKRPPVFYAR